MVAQAFQSAPERPRIRTLVVDDAAGVRDQVSAFLGDAGLFEIVGYAADGAEAVEQAAALNPDLVLMDLNMPRRNGLDAAREIKARDPAPRVIILSLEDQPDMPERVRRAGADGFCRKVAVEEDLLPLVRALFPAAE